MTHSPAPGRRAPARLALILVLVSLLALAGCERVRLDENLCPVGQTPPRTTILMLDTSDPLSPKQREVFARLVKEMQDADGKSEFRIGPGEALVVYELSQDLDDIEPTLRVCNPGSDPDKWTWQQGLTQGRAIALRRWQRFEELVEPLFSAEETPAQNRSPIIEFLGAIVPKHVPSRRLGSETRTHLIVYSDLLQHTDTLSHYRPYPPADKVFDTPGLRQLRTDLAGVDVSLYRLERARYARWQTVKHYYWWTVLVEKLGGMIVWQESV